MILALDTNHLDKHLNQVMTDADSKICLPTKYTSTIPRKDQKRVGTSYNISVKVLHMPFG